MRRLLLSLAIFLGILIVGYFAAGMWWIYNATSAVTDVAKYEKVIDPLKENLAAHFPKVIPVGAEAKFFYVPGFLQGATFVQLKLTASPEQIQAAQRDFEGQALKKWYGQRPPGDSLNLMPLQLNESEVKGLDCKIFLLQTTPPEEWNHPRRSGVSINEKYGEIVYWLEIW